MNLKVIHTKNLRWIDCANPTRQDLDYLWQNFELHPLDFQDLIAISQHPKLENREKYHLLVLLFPVYNREMRAIRAAEVDFIIGKDYVITIHDGSMYTMQNLVKSVSSHDELRNHYMGKNPGFLLFQILESLFTRSFPILDHMTKDMVVAESRVFNDLSIKMLEEISMLKRNIIDSRRIMKTHHLIIKKLMSQKDPYLVFRDSKDYYVSLLERAENIWDILAIQKETVEALQDANQALAANQLNHITKTFTLMSAIFFPATLIMFIFGMSMDFIPLKQNPYGFWIVMLLALACSTSVFAFLRSKRWF